MTDLLLTFTNASHPFSRFYFAIVGHQSIDFPIPHQVFSIYSTTQVPMLTTNSLKWLAYFLCLLRLFLPFQESYPQLVLLPIPTILSAHLILNSPTTFHDRRKNMKRVPNMQIKECLTKENNLPPPPAILPDASGHTLGPSGYFTGLITIASGPKQRVPTQYKDRIENNLLSLLSLFQMNDWLWGNFHIPDHDVIVYV